MNKITSTYIIPHWKGTTSDIMCTNTQFSFHFGYTVHKQCVLLLWMWVKATSCSSQKHGITRQRLWRSPSACSSPCKIKAANQYVKHRNTGKTNGLRMGKWSGKWIFKLPWKAFASGIWNWGATKEQVIRAVKNLSAKVLRVHYDHIHYPSLSTNTWPGLLILD